MKRMAFVCQKNSCRSQMWVLPKVFEDWQLDAPDGQPLETFQRLRDEIKQRVTQLVNKISG